MKVCLNCVEPFAWGKYGGLGRAARMLWPELVKQGIGVFAVVQKRTGQQPEENPDGVTVLVFPRFEPWKALRFTDNAKQISITWGLVNRLASLKIFYALNNSPRKVCSKQ